MSLYFVPKISTSIYQSSKGKNVDNNHFPMFRWYQKGDGKINKKESNRDGLEDI